MRTRLMVAALAGLLGACGAQQAGVSNETTAASATATEERARPRRGARPERPDRAVGFLRADANGDGVVTRAEIETEAETRFARLDTDGDGTMTVAEQVARREAAAERRGEPVRQTRPPVQQTRVAYVEQARERFNRRDSDGDGRLSGQELENRQSRRRAEPEAD